MAGESVIYSSPIAVSSLFAERMVIAAAALGIEAACGYPDPVFRRIGHPVSWVGRLIDGLDRNWNDERCSIATRRARGVAAIGVIAGAGLAAGWAAARAGRAAVLLGAASLVAAGSLDRHVAAVASAASIPGADGEAASRAALARIVGRDTHDLDRAAIARAAIESLAENFSDGVVAPLLWFGLGGLPGMAFYKAVNTADSMIGHRSTRHAAFGWAAARLDDLINLPASRLSALLIGLGSGRPRASLRAARRDARAHRSPNAGWPEAAMAGALGLALNGPKHYAGVATDDAWMGDGRTATDIADIGRALGVHRRSTVLAAASLLLAAAIARKRKSNRLGIE